MAISFFISQEVQPKNKPLQEENYYSCEILFLLLGGKKKILANTLGSFWTF